PPGRARWRWRHGPSTLMILQMFILGGTGHRRLHGPKHPTYQRRARQRGGPQSGTSTASARPVVGSVYCTTPRPGGTGPPAVPPEAGHNGPVHCVSVARRTRGRATAADGGPRAPRRRVEQGRGDDGDVRRRRGRRPGGDVYRG